MSHLVALALSLSLAGTASAAGGYSGGPASGLETRFVAGWDANGDGVVTLAEIRRFPPAVFARFDRDGDGLLDAHETARFDAHRQADLRAAGGRYRPEVARMVGGLTLKRNDIDGNGRISPAEFRLGGGDWLALLDRDGNGEVTAVDFAAR